MKHENNKKKKRNTSNMKLKKKKKTCKNFEPKMLIIKCQVSKVI